MGYPAATTHATILDKTQKRILLIAMRNPLGQILWGFPGGHIRIGEKVKDALTREVREETGYDIEVGELLGVYDNIISDAHLRIVDHIINVIWIAKVVSGKLDFSKDEEIIEAKWFTLAESKELKMSSTAKRILRDAQSLIDRGTKLVRNNIPKMIEDSGKETITHTANEEEYLDSLKAKLKEEADEFLDSGNVEELVDIIEVLYALSELKGITVRQLEQKRRRKASERGRFEKRIILDDVM